MHIYNLWFSPATAILQTPSVGTSMGVNEDNGVCRNIQRYCLLQEVDAGLKFVALGILITFLHLEVHDLELLNRMSSDSHAVSSTYIARDGSIFVFHVKSDAACRIKIVLIRSER